MEQNSFVDLEKVRLNILQNKIKVGLSEFECRPNIQWTSLKLEKPLLETLLTKVDEKSLPLTFAKEDTSLNDGGWILEHKSLQDIQDKLAALTPYEADLETIEAIRLIIAGEDALLKKRMEELEDF